MSERDDVDGDESAGAGVGDHPDDELLDLALGHVTGERRTALAQHLLACPRCRQEHDRLVGAIEEVAAAAPPVQPPLGFDERVVARMVPATEPTGRRRTEDGTSRPRRLLPAVAAAVLVALLLGAAGGWWAGRDDGPTDRVATLSTEAGQSVGTATVTEVDGDPVLVVGISTAPDGVSYTCRMRFADGSTMDTEPWSVAPGAGWLVPLPEDRGELAHIALVTDTGWTWSTADLHT